MNLNEFKWIDMELHTAIIKYVNINTYIIIKYGKIITAKVQFSQ